MKNSLQDYDLLLMVSKRDKDFSLGSRGVTFIFCIKTMTHEEEVQVMHYYRELVH